MESCTIVNRYCIQTAVTTLHNQLQSANMSPSMVKKKALLQSLCLQNSYVDSLVNFGQPACP